jgi:hypothetical protein
MPATSGGENVWRHVLTTGTPGNAKKDNRFEGGKPTSSDLRLTKDPAKAPYIGPSPDFRLHRPLIPRRNSWRLHLLYLAGDLRRRQLRASYKSPHRHPCPGQLPPGRSRRIPIAPDLNPNFVVGHSRLLPVGSRFLSATVLGDAFVAPSTYPRTSAGRSRSNNHNRDDASAGSPRVEGGADRLLHRKLAALIAAKPKRGRGARLREGDKGDLHGRPVFTNDRAQLYNADRTTDARGTGGQSTTDKNVPATGEGQEQTKQQEGEKGIHGPEFAPRLD